MESSTEALILAKLESIADDVAVLRRLVVEGNGRPPLTERIAALEATAHPKDVKSKKAVAGFWAAVVAIATAVSAMAQSCSGLT